MVSPISRRATSLKAIGRHMLKGILTGALTLVLAATTFLNTSQSVYAGGGGGGLGSLCGLSNVSVTVEPNSDILLLYTKLIVRVSLLAGTGASLSPRRGTRKLERGIRKPRRPTTICLVSTATRRSKARGTAPMIPGLRHPRTPTRTSPADTPACSSPNTEEPIGRTPSATRSAPKCASTTPGAPVWALAGVTTLCPSPARRRPC
jgi:hypothetical protein